ncbi:MAG: sugar phosphate isomerase/epimerase family protein [Candidatus Brocadiia bacterium]
MATSPSRRQFLRRGLAATAAATLGTAPRAAPAAEPPTPKPSAKGIHLGLVTYMVGARMDLPTLLRTCEQSGMEGVELRSTHRHGVEPRIDAEARAAVRQAFAQTEVRLVGLGSACEYHSPKPEVVRRNVEQTQRFVQLAADVGAWGVKVRPNGLPRGVPEETTLRQIAEALRECGEAAAEKGIVLFVECHGSGTAHPPRMARIMELCDHPWVGLCWNCNRGVDFHKGSIRTYFEQCKPWVRHVHIHDLAGRYPYDELFALLKGMDFDGFTMLETHTKEDPTDFLRKQRALWEKLVG